LQNLGTDFFKLIKTGADAIVQQNSGDQRKLFSLNPSGLSEIFNLGSLSPQYFRTLNEETYFDATDQNGFKNLYVTNGTAEGTKRLARIGLSQSFRISQITSFRDQVLFSVTDSALGLTWGRTTLWKTDGSPEGTSTLKFADGSDFRALFGMIFSVFENRIIASGLFESGKNFGPETGAELFEIELLVSPN